MYLNEYLTNIQASTNLELRSRYLHKFAESSVGGCPKIKIHVIFTCNIYKLGHFIHYCATYTCIRNVKSQLVNMLSRFVCIETQTNKFPQRNNLNVQ